MGDNHTIHKVSLKRTRQACGPCRRKKARCPGEKPTCSLCHRLGQRCSYGPQASRVRSQPISPVQSQEPQNSINETPGDISSSGRLQRIEERLDMMAILLQEGLPRSNSLREVSSDNHLNDGRELQEASYDDFEIPDCPENHSLNSQENGLPVAFIEQEVQTYLTYFHDQPYCPLSKKWLLRHTSSLPPEVAFPLVALTSRLPRRSRGPSHENTPDVKIFAEKAWDLLSNQYKDGNMGLSFLQGTFLMAQLDFADGKAHRGYASVSLGLRAIQSAGLNKQKDSYFSDDLEIETRKRITWAFFMLDRTYCASRNYSLSLSDKQFTLPFPICETDALPGDNGSLAHGSLHDGPGKQGQKVDHGILVCLLRLYSLWGKATEYVFEPFADGSLPPWQTGSALAILESEWLQFETHFADAHRYINVDFKSRARETPRPRTYLSTWVCVQFLFHSIQGLLHHPFVIMTKLRNFNGNLSATFLQKSFETSLLHSRWIVRFIKEMSEVNFETCDPFLGYLAAIAATIQLEHTGSKNPQIALLLNKEFRILVDFMTELSVYWENMSVLVNKVNELAARHQNYGSLYYNQEGFSGALSKMPTPSNMPRMSAEDECLMWEILDFGCSSGGDVAISFGNLAIPQGSQTQANEGHPVQSRMSRPQRVLTVSSQLRRYLQLVASDETFESTDTDEITEIPTCFTESIDASPAASSESRLLVIDSASDIGGTWAKERLYPNLLSQNSYGLYEFSDLPLSDVVPEEHTDGAHNQFIAGWKINRYLRVWIEKWQLEKHIRLNWTLLGNQGVEAQHQRVFSPGSTHHHYLRQVGPGYRTNNLVPNLPDTTGQSMASDNPVPVIHAKDVGDWAREHLGYQPLKAPEPETVSIPVKNSPYPQLRSIAIYGGAKSSFDLVHFFATLHRNDSKLHLKSTQKDLVQVHWIIRDRGVGPAWMVPPMSTLPNGDTVASDKAASSRLLTHFTPCCYKAPKRLSLGPSRSLHREGSWRARLLHDNPIGRWWIRGLWRPIDKGLEDTAQYGSDPKMERLRPENSVVSCASGIGIANQGDLWETIRLPHVNVYRSTITDIVATRPERSTDSSTKASVHLADSNRIDEVDLVIHATGYKPIVPIRFEPASLRFKLGLSALVNSRDEDIRENRENSAETPERINGPLEATVNNRIQYWEELDRQSEVMVRKTLNATGCVLTDRSPPSWAESHKLVPYRLFRRMVAPELVARGDRSFATLGVILSSTIAVVVEVQALWALSLENISLETMENVISEDVILGSLTGNGLAVKAIQYNGMLLRDLGLNPHRLGGALSAELTGVYRPSVYAGIVDEWKRSRGLTKKP
ncbi:hypothetical protein VN97_g710 [Penicillium thymicola]|uniref:Zn(2)-C6 fungal-type domain-containing protein n=1 Tax=Penicillium thymicola TaxID=293382 RepID=A0AAI9TSB4_PENTH|nr:hypothetical protein VN97_g710 [Penicillium thymicola]